MLVGVIPSILLDAAIFNLKCLQCALKLLGVDWHPFEGLAGFVNDFGYSLPEVSVAKV